MKAYKYHRSSYTWHWSQSFSEDIIYIPEAKIFIYKGGQGDRNYAGISSSLKTLEEAEQYVSDVLSEKIKKFVNDEHKEYSEFIKFKEKNMEIEEILQERGKFSIETITLQDKTYVKEIPAEKNSFALTLNNFEEVNIDITLENINKMIEEQNHFEILKLNFEIEKKKFEKNVRHLETLIKSL